MISAQTASANRSIGFVVNISPKTRWLGALLFPAIAGPLWCLAWHGTTGRFGTLSGLVLVAALLTSAVTDFKFNRIFNWTTYPTFLWAILTNLLVLATTYGVVSQVPAFAPAPILGPHFLGGVGIGECLAGAAVCFLITVFGYDLSGGGAGDVKLATCIGAVLGFHDGIFAVAYSYVVAAIAIILWSTYKNGPLALVKAAIRSIGRVFGPLWPFPTTSDDQTLLLTPVPLGPYFAIGTLLVLLGIVPT